MAYRIKITARLDKDVRRLLNAQIGRAIGYLSGVLEDGGSSIHATRKCLKRCRAILRLVKPGLSAKAFRDQDRALRDIARLLSHDRDREVMADTLTMLAAKSAGDEKSALALALDELKSITLNGFAHSKAEESVGVAIARLQESDHRIHRLAIRGVGIATLAEGFAATYAEGRKTLKAAYRIDDDEAVHTFRKSLQHHWRHCQLLAPAWPEAMNVRIAAARDLSQMIGVDHDLSLVVGHFGPDGGSALDEGVRDRVCAAARAEQARLRDEAYPLARRLYALKPRDMERMILGFWPAAVRLARHRRKPEAAEYPVDEVVPLKA